MSRGAVKPKPRVREIEGIPGTVEPGYKEHPIIEVPLPENVRQVMLRNGVDPAEMKVYAMGACSIFVGHEPAALDGAKLWHLTISTPSRHPTWDEIKTARYRLLPLDLTFGMLLPPPEVYVNVPEQDHVMQLWEITDPEGAVDSRVTQEIIDRLEEEWFCLNCGRTRPIEAWGKPCACGDLAHDVLAEEEE